MSKIPRRLIRGLFVFLVAAAAVCCSLPSAPAADWKFDVRFSEEIRDQSYSGRVYLFFSRTRPEPREQRWFFNLRKEPCASLEVKNWQPGKTLGIRSDSEGLRVFAGVSDGKNFDGYRVQAVARFNPLSRTIGSGAGNGYSQAVKIIKGGELPVLAIDSLEPAREFTETRWVKLLQVRSKLLSDFHDREEVLNAAVQLPASYYNQPERRYPVIFIIPGFGGTHHHYSGRDEPVQEENRQEVEFIRVLLDPSCPLGHHVFADSANNGPVGEALTTELIPGLDKRFRTIAEPGARFLTGHSSGGWSSLWLQVTYPEFFGGTWSTAPDPVDFRDFQQINLYEPGEIMYFDDEGEKRPIARNGGRVLMYYREFAENEWTLGYGGQLHSFEAVFSPRGKDGKPRLVWDRETGAVNTEVARTWEKYDIRLVLERNWKTLGPKLKDKLHVFMGSEDTFYLEGATILLKKSLEELNADAVVEIHPGKDHGSLMTRELRERIRGDMVETFLKNHPVE